MLDTPSVNELAIALQKNAVGQPVQRKEDETLLRGKGRYTDDFAEKGQAYAWLVRSSHAHGLIKSIDIAAAKAMPGVLGIWTGADLGDAYGPFTVGLPLKNRDGSPLKQTNRLALATEKVRFVGDPVAVVVAETVAQARDAAEAVGLDIDPLPAVTDAAEAARPGAPLLYEHIPHNVALDYHYGDTDAVDAAFAAAAHTVTMDIANTRVAVVPMEPRCAIASYDAKADRYTIRLPTQGVSGNRNTLAKALLKVAPEKVRVLTGNVGGSFGMKNISYPEYVAIIHAAKALGRPVKWTDERSGSFLSDSHGRAQKIHAEMALDEAGRFLAVRLSGYGNLGAYITGVSPSPLSLNTGKNLASVYRTPLIQVDVKCVVTNTTLMGAYRGAGRPEANYFMERLIDRAAEVTGIDRLTLRKRNLIKTAQLPFKAASGVTYDSGDFPGLLAQALEVADYAGFARRKRESRKNGRLRGIGVGSYLEVTAPPSPELGKITFDADGGVTLVTGTLDYGQGHATPFAQVLSAQLGIPFDKIRLEQNDSDIVHTGNGTGGSRSITASSMAIVEASKIVIAKGKSAAAQVLETSEADIEFASGAFTVAGTDRSIGIMELAAKLREAKGAGGLPASLDVDHTSEAVPSTFPNGCHVAEVEIDPDTGKIEIVRYTGISDFGVVVNPMIVAGQLHGGVAQGIGQALMEEVRYDSSGQPITGSFMDYAMPRAEDIPFMTTGDHPSPAPTNPIGTKGCGEAGCAGSLSTVVNAVIDALSEHGVTHLDMPLTTEKIWRAIRDGRAANAA
jgi:carbon-monoxide dehydrogenase large subunit